MTKLSSRPGPAELAALQLIVTNGHSFTHGNGRWANHNNEPNSIHQTTISRLERRGLIDYGFRVDPERYNRPGMPLTVVLTDAGRAYVATLNNQEDNS